MWMGEHLDKLLELAAVIDVDATDSEAHEHLLRECPWYRHVDGGGAEDVERHCQPTEESGAVPRLVVKLTPRTPEASTVPQPTVPPGGPGLWHVKGMQLPPLGVHPASLQASGGPVRQGEGLRRGQGHRG